MKHRIKNRPLRDRKRQREAREGGAARAGQRRLRDVARLAERSCVVNDL